MKKVVSLLLAMVLACGMSMTALAGEAAIRTTVPERHTVTVEADGGKVITDNKVCGDTVLIERQKEQTWWIVPDGGKELDKLYYNGEDVTGQMAGSTFTAPALIGDAALKAVFEDAEASAGDGYTVGGTITDEDDHPIPGATVDIGGYTGTTDEDGSFNIPDVPPGTYPVVITDENGNIIGIGEITLGQPGDDGPTVAEDENGNPVITPGTGNTNIDLTIVVNGDGSIGLEDVDAYTRDENLNNPETVTAPAEDGSAAVTLEDGTKITVTGITEDGLWLVVRPITDPELVAWFEKCVAPYGTHIYPMDIYFVDSRGVRTEISGTITVTVETRKDYSEPIVCDVAPDGAVTVMESRVSGKEISFRTDHNSYYVLAEKVPGTANTQPGSSGGTGSSDGTGSSGGTGSSDGTGSSGGTGSSDGTGSSGKTDGHSPQTGDISDPHSWSIMMLLGCCGLVGCILFSRKKKQDED